MKTTVTIPPQILKTCARFASKDSTRDAFQCVEVSVTTADITVTATDGRRLICFRRPNTGEASEPFSFLIQKSLLQNLPPCKSDLCICVDDGGVQITGDTLSATGPIPDCRYPNWKMTFPSVMPKVPSRMTVDASIFADFGAAFRAVTKCGTVSINSADEYSVIVVTSGAHNTDEWSAIGLIMPVRSDAVTEIPQWVK